MPISLPRAALLTFAATIAGCATGPRVEPGAEVTRFHLIEHPVARGDIAIEPINPAMAGTLEFATVAEAVAEELAALGWRVVPAVGGARSEQVALVDFDQGSRAAMARRPAVSVGVGGGTGGWGRSGVGVGVGATVPVGGGGAGEIVVSELIVRLQRRSDATAFWEARASAEARADAPEASPAVAADLLANAAFEGFPGESGRTIRVR